MNTTPAEPIVDDKPVSVAETLRAARALIQDRRHWIQGAYARRRRRSVLAVMLSSPEAGAWCLVGALLQIDGPYEHDALIWLAETITGREVFGRSHARECVVRFNDAEERHHQDVIRMLDRAIANAEARS